jgi:hypothetical protein
MDFLGSAQTVRKTHQTAAVWFQFWIMTWEILITSSWINQKTASGLLG